MQHSDFARDFLDRIAATFGLSCEQLSADFGTVAGESAREREQRAKAIRWWRAWDAQREFEDAIMRRWMMKIVFSIYIGDSIEQIVGYDPQRLLGAPA